MNRVRCIHPNNEGNTFNIIIPMKSSKKNKQKQTCHRYHKCKFHSEKFPDEYIIYNHKGATDLKVNKEDKRNNYKQITNLKSCPSMRAHM